MFAPEAAGIAAAAELTFRPSDFEHGDSTLQATTTPRGPISLTISWLAWPGLLSLCLLITGCGFALGRPALVFNVVFFPTFEPLVGTLLAFSTYAVGYVARPLGGLVFGHLGDRVGAIEQRVASNGHVVRGRRRPAGVGQQDAGLLEQLADGSHLEHGRIFRIAVRRVDRAAREDVHVAGERHRRRAVRE